MDAMVRGWMVTHQVHFLRSIAGGISAYGNVANVCWVALLVALVFLSRGRQAAAAAAGVAATLGVAAYSMGKDLIVRARPPGAIGLGEITNSFPSAHATESTAVCVALAYVCWREALMPKPLAVVLAIAIPLAVGASRLYLDVHWATDVLAGWILGGAIGAAATFVYRRLAPPPES